VIIEFWILISYIALLPIKFSQNLFASFTIIGYWHLLSYFVSFNMVEEKKIEETLSLSSFNTFPFKKPPSSWLDLVNRDELESFISWLFVDSIFNNEADFSVLLNNFLYFQYSLKNN